MWIARDKEGYLMLFDDKPKRYLDSENDRWIGDNPANPPSSVITRFVKLRWSDEPIRLMLVPVDSVVMDKFEHTRLEDNITKEEKSICYDCTKEIKCGYPYLSGSCTDFIQKTCGVCDEHGEHKYKLFGSKKCLAECSLNKHVTSDTLKAGQITSSCQWKPIKPVCETCGGDKRVCGHCGLPDGECTADWTHLDFEEDFGINPCPTCQGKPEKEKRLMVPVRWYECKHGDFRLEVIVNNQAKLIQHISLTIQKKYKISGNITQQTYETIEQAKTAVEKALRIEKQ